MQENILRIFTSVKEEQKSSLDSILCSWVGYRKGLKLFSLQLYLELCILLIDIKLLLIKTCKRCGFKLSIYEKSLYPSTG